MSQSPSVGAIDPHAAEAYPAGLYNPAAIAETIDGFAAVTDERIEQYRRDGFLAIENAFTPGEVEAAGQGLADLIMGRVPDFKSIQFESWAADVLSTLPLERRQDAVRKLMHFTPHEQRLRAMADHPELLALLERLLGDTPERFQDMALLKPPNGREKPWHQDHAYFNLPLGTRVVGIWIALDEVRVENGCMHVLAGEHHEPFLHFKRRDWQICDDEMLGRKCVAVPLKPGGCLVFDGLLPHGTPANRTGSRRRAVQFHYRPVHVNEISQEQRMAIFGSEGKDVTC